MDTAAGVKEPEPERNKRLSGPRPKPIVDHSSPPRQHTPERPRAKHENHKPSDDKHEKHEKTEKHSDSTDKHEKHVKLEKHDKDKHEKPDHHEKHKIEKQKHQKHKQEHLQHKLDILFPALHDWQPANDPSLVKPILHHLAELDPEAFELIPDLSAKGSILFDFLKTVLLDGQHHRRQISACSICKHIAQSATSWRMLVTPLRNNVVQALVILLDNNDKALRKASKQVFEDLCTEGKWLPLVKEGIHSKSKDHRKHTRRMMRDAPILYDIFSTEPIHHDLFSSHGHPHDLEDVVNFMYKLHLNTITAKDIKHIAEYHFLELLPVISGVLRQHTVSINQIPSELDSSMIKTWEKSWTSTLNQIIQYLSSNVNAGQQASWLEEAGLGFVQKQENSLNKYGVTISYISQAWVDTHQFWSILAARWGDLNTQMKADNLAILCPVGNQQDHLITEVEILKVFTSKSRPLLVNFKFLDSNIPSKKAIFKQGTIPELAPSLWFAPLLHGIVLLTLSLANLTKDIFAESLFHMFNILWSTSGIPPASCPYLERYTIVNIGSHKTRHGVADFSLIECIDATSVEKMDWTLVEKLTDEQLQVFVRSAAGAYAMGHALMLRDRHRDNMMVRKLSDGGLAFTQIDFEYLLCDNTSLAPSLAIPYELEEVLESRGQWDNFISITIDGFMVLHRHSSLLINLITQLYHDLPIGKAGSATGLLEHAMYGWSPTKDKYYLPKLLSETLMVGLPESVIRKRMREGLQNASKSLTLALKDIAHTKGQQLAKIKPPKESITTKHLGISPGTIKLERQRSREALPNMIQAAVDTPPDSPKSTKSKSPIQTPPDSPKKHRPDSPPKRSSRTHSQHHDGPSSPKRTKSPHQSPPPSPRTKSPHQSPPPSPKPNRKTFDPATSDPS